MNALRTEVVTGPPEDMLAAVIAGAVAGSVAGGRAAVVAPPITPPAVAVEPVVEPITPPTALDDIAGELVEVAVMDATEQMLTGHPKALVNISSIWVPAGRRPLDELTVAALMMSIADIGQQVPVAVLHRPGGRDELVAGRHRLEACKRLGHAVRVETFTDRDAAARWELDENSARQHWSQEDLTEQRRKRVVMVAAQQKEVKGHAEPKLPTSHPKASTGVGRGVGGGRPKGAVSIAAKAEGVSVSTMKRAVKPKEAAKPVAKETTPKRKEWRDEAIARLAEELIDICPKDRMSGLLSHLDEACVYKLPDVIRAKIAAALPAAHAA